MTHEKLDRTKPIVNVGTIGHAYHGKTMLTAAVTAALAHSMAKQAAEEVGKTLTMGLSKHASCCAKCNNSNCKKRK